VGDFLELVLGSGVVVVLVCRNKGSARAGRARGRGLCAIRDIPGWNLRAPVLYAFFNSCSVAFGET
jgi:hypothetical protein